MSTRVWILLMAAASAGCFGHQPLTEEQKMNSSAGVERTQAVLSVGERQDRSKIPTLINRLEDDDVAVRIAAINSLRSMTGQDFGYVAYDSEVKHRAAVVKWRAWWRTQGSNAPTQKQGEPARSAPRGPGGAGQPSGGKP